jgi:hypothetical protein
MDFLDCIGKGGVNVCVGGVFGASLGLKTGYD